MFFKKTRAAGFLAVTAVYLAAGALGVAAYRLLPCPFWLSLLIADAAATVFTFLFSLLFRNASVYDPYWSVAPMVIAAGFAAGKGTGPVRIMLMIAVFLWGLRLTANWAYTFRGLSFQDWRYTMLQERTGKGYPFVNFTGIHMVPTLIVYGCVLPLVFAFEYEPKGNSLSVLGFLICLSAVVLQTVSDVQMHRFRRSGKGGLIDSGLWRYARHPNYLGEIAMWWGIALCALSALPQFWYLAAGAFCNTLLFLLVSIPMADERQSKKPGWAAYKAGTRMLLPIPKRVKRQEASI